VTSIEHSVPNPDNRTTKNFIREHRSSDTDEQWNTTLDANSLCYRVFGVTSDRFDGIEIGILKKTDNDVHVNLYIIKYTLLL